MLSRVESKDEVLGGPLVRRLATYLGPCHPCYSIVQRKHDLVDEAKAQIPFNIAFRRSKRLVERLMDSFVIIQIYSFVV